MADAGTPASEITLRHSAPCPDWERLEGAWAAAVNYHARSPV